MAKFLLGSLVGTTMRSSFVIHFIFEDKDNMDINPLDSIGLLARKHPQIIPLFDSWGLDYCCNGLILFIKAVESIGLPLAEALAQLEAVLRKPCHAATYQVAAASMSVGELIDAIEATHHDYTRQALTDLVPFIKRVRALHGTAHPELVEIQHLFNELKNALEPHLLKEEQVLFPLIRLISQAKSWDEITAIYGSGSTEGSIIPMHINHDDIAHILKRLAILTNAYTPPRDCCNIFRQLYADLKAFERDLHQHIHLENNILFPQAAELETRLRERSMDTQQDFWVNFLDHPKTELILPKKGA